MSLKLKIKLLEKCIAEKMPIWMETFSKMLPSRTKLISKACLYMFWYCEIKHPFFVLFETHLTASLKHSLAQLCFNSRQNTLRNLQDET